MHLHWGGYWQLFSMILETKVHLLKWSTVGVLYVLCLYENTYFDLKYNIGSCMMEVVFTEGSSAPF